MLLTCIRHASRIQVEECIVKRIRKQIYLDPWQEERLVDMARRARLSEAEIVRNAIDAYLLAVDELPSDHPFSVLAGMGASRKGSFGGSDHDHVIYQA